MFAQNRPQYRNRNDSQQSSHQNIPSGYKRNHNNRAAYSYIMNPEASNVPSSPHRGHLHHNHFSNHHHYIQNKQCFISDPHQHHGHHPHRAPHPHHHASSALNRSPRQKRKARHNNHKNNKNGYRHRNRSGYNNNVHHYARVASHPPPAALILPSDIVICIDTVGPQLIQYLPASTAYYLIEIIEPYLTNRTLHKVHNNNRVPLRRKSELLSKWHHSYAASKRMTAYLDCNDILDRLYHFNAVNAMNKELSSRICIWNISIKKSEIEQYFGTSRDLLIRSVLSYIIMECFLRNKHSVWFPDNVTRKISIEKQLNIGDIYKFLVSKLQKIDDIKKFYSKSLNVHHPKIENNDYLLCLLNEFKSRFERDNFGGDTLLYCHSWISHKFEHILSDLAARYPVHKNRKRVKKSAIYELGFRSRLDRPIFGFYIGTHKGYNPRTKGIELKFNPASNYSYFNDLKWLFLPEFIEDEVINYFSFDIKWESDYTRGEHFKYFNLICADVNCSNANANKNDLYQRFKFVVWKGQYFDADDNLLGQYSE